MDVIFSITAISLSMFAFDKISEKIYRYFKPDDSIVPHNARWFFIHSMANIMITCLTYPDVQFCLTNYEICIYNPWNFYTQIALITAFCLHFYHIIMFFNRLTKGDWIHHIIMVGITGPITILQGSRCVGLGLWFICGLPGMLDYFLLWLVKLGFLTSMHEKQAYVWISTWIRSPGCLLTCFSFLPKLKQNLSPSEMMISLISLFLVFWNGQYYMMITCRDFGKKLRS